MFESQLNKGKANGYTPLNTEANVPVENLNSLVDVITFSAPATISSQWVYIDTRAWYRYIIEEISLSADDGTTNLTLWTGVSGSNPAAGVTGVDVSPGYPPVIFTPTNNNIVNVGDSIGIAINSTTSNWLNGSMKVRRASESQVTLIYDNITNVPVVNPTNVGEWNTFFNSPVGVPFTSVKVSGNIINLYGASGIALRDSLFDDSANSGTHLLSFADTGCIVSAGYDVFGTDNNSGCPNLTTIILPSLNTIGNYCFANCTALTIINLPACIALGNDTGNNNVFNGINGKTLTLTVPTSLSTCDGGSPDGDITNLVGNNTVTVNYI